MLQGISTSRDMKSFTLVSIVVVAVVTLIQVPHPASGVCCGGLRHVASSWFSKLSFGGSGVELRAHQCNDCTRPTPFCGKGKCNIFGCNCNGGCREGSCERRKRSIDGEELSAQDDLDVSSIVDDGDLNGDGALSIREAQLMFRRSGIDVKQRTLRKMDANHDGQLLPEEIDADSDA